MGNFSIYDLNILFFYPHKFIFYHFYPYGQHMLGMGKKQKKMFLNIKITTIILQGQKSKMNKLKGLKYIKAKEIL